MARPDNLFETDSQNAHAPSDEQIAAMPPIFRRIWESIIASQRAQIGPVRIAEGDAGWQKAAREGLGIPLAYLANAVGLGFEGTANVGKVGIGSLLTTLGQANRASGLARALTPGFLEDPARQALASYEADTNGNPITAMMDANEAAASGNEFTVGVLDQLLDPANIADIAKGGKWLIEGAPKGARALGRLGKSLAGMGPEDATQLLPTGLDLSHHPNIPGNVPDIQMKPGIGFAGGGGLGPTLPSQPGNVPLEDLIAGIGTEGGGIGPVLPYRSGNANVLHGPDIPLMVNQPQMPSEVYRDLFGTPGNVPANELRPGVGAMVDRKNPQRLGIGPRIDELLQGPPVPDSLIDEWLNEGTDVTQGFERNYAGQLLPGEMTAFGQLLEDMGPVANPEQNRRKMALARKILTDMGLEDPLYADIDYVDSAGRKVLDKVSGPILSPEQVIAARKQIGNLGVERPLSAEERLSNRVGDLLERPIPRRPEAVPKPKSLGEALQPVGPRPALDRAARLAGRVAGYSDSPMVGDAAEQVARQVDEVPSLVPDRLPQLPDPIYNRPSLDEALQRAGPLRANELRPGIGAMVDGKNPRRMGIGPTIDELLYGPHDPGPPMGPEIPAGMQRDLLSDLPPTGAAKPTDLLAPTGEGARPRTPNPQAIDQILRAEKVGDWSDLTPDEIETLVRWGYNNNEDAISNAYLKYRDPADLAARAFERIGQLPRASFEQFSRSYPDLARKVALLPGLDELRSARRLADDALADENAIAAIEAGPYVAAFRYFTPDGGLRIDPTTGKRFHRSRDLAEAYRGSGEGFDEIAANILDGYYGSSANHDIGDYEFWEKARDEYLRYRKLTARPQVDELGFTPQGEYRGVPKPRPPRPPRDKGISVEQIGEGGDIAAGGMGIMPAAPGRAGMIAQTSGLGALAGYGAGSGGIADGETSDDERNAAVFGAVVGAVLGGGAGSRAGQAIIRLVPRLWENGVAAQREAWRTGRGMSLADIGRVWKTQTTSTIRNLLQDEVISRLWLARAGVRQRVMNENWYSLVDLYERGIRDGYEALPQRSRMLLDRIGKGPTFGPTRSGRGLLAKSNPGYVPGLGQSLSEANDRLVRALHPLTTAKIEAGLSLVTPLASVPVAGVALGAVKGLTRAAWTEVFQSINHFTHAAARHAVWQESMVDDLAQAAERFTRIDPALSRLSPDGLFSADEVFNLTGDRSLADRWGAVVDAAIARGEARAKEVFGDFSNEQWWERVLSSVVPFASWAIRAYPRTIAMMAEHPGITLAILAAVERDSQRAKEEGRPGYQVGSLKFDSQTPVLGKLLGGMLAGGQGDLRVNILGALSPFSGELFAGADDSAEEQTPYQKAKGLVGKTGFSFNPFLVGLAYALDWDYIRPGAMSRTAGIEQAMAGPEIPSAMQGPLDFVREKMGGSVSKTSPTERRWAQNLYDETGYAAGAPQNAAIAAASVLPGDPRMALAERQTGQGGLVRNLASLILPATVSAETDTAAYARRSADYARENPPVQVDPAIMESLKAVNPLAAILLQDTQRNMVGEGALINRDADQTSRAYAALQAWSDENANMRYFMPAYYWEKEAELRKLLGLPPRKD